MEIKEVVDRLDTLYGLIESITTKIAEINKKVECQNSRINELVDKLAKEDNLYCSYHTI